MFSLLSGKNITVACTILITYLILNSHRTIDVIGSITTVTIALFIILLNINPDILMQISAILISIGSQYYEYNEDH